MAVSGTGKMGIMVMTLESRMNCRASYVQFLFIQTVTEVPELIILSLGMVPAVTVAG